MCWAGFLAARGNTMTWSCSRRPNIWQLEACRVSLSFVCYCYDDTSIYITFISVYILRFYIRKYIICCWHFIIKVYKNTFFTLRLFHPWNFRMNCIEYLFVLKTIYGVSEQKTWTGLLKTTLILAHNKENPFVLVFFVTISPPNTLS